MLRHAVSVYVLPEVCDPTARNEAGHAANFSVFLPFAMPLPGALTFDVLVRNEAGETVWQHRIEDDTELRDLRMARARARMPVADYPDGRYTVEVRTRIDEQEPRPTDPELRWTFFVLRGYQERAEVRARRGSAGARISAGVAEGAARWLCSGGLACVPAAKPSRSRAMRSANSNSSRPCCKTSLRTVHRSSGFAGACGRRCPASIPCCRSSFRCPRIQRRPPARPLIVCATGGPVYGTGSRRPTEPSSRSPAWLQRELGRPDQFGEAAGYRLVTVASPGMGLPFGKSLRAMLEAAESLLPTGGKRPLLVCDREAAAVVALHLHDFVDRVSGIVFVGAGAVPQRAMAAVGDLPVRAVALRGYPGSRAIDRMQQFLAQRGPRGESGFDYSLLHDRALPWPFGVALSRAELLRFARQLFGDG